MYLEPNVKHRLKIQVGEYLEGDTVSFCSDLLHDNLNFLDHVTCNAVGSILEVIFHPPNEITDDFIFEVVTNTIQNAGLSFISAVMSQYVGSNIRTATGSLIGGLLGGIWGVLLGAAAAQLFTWKDICQCRDNGFGSLIIEYFGEETK